MAKKSDMEMWNRFAREALSTDGVSNVCFSFKELTKKYGRAYISYLKAAWEANDECLSQEEFLKINGNVPIGFFNKVVNCG